ncbi:MAG: FAD-dependent oxidoreductase [Rhodospirillaceae bacterium]|nr:FAD-dependent oxidoreductase [Rhodospirillaceae bacterium]|tara:strand:+ start:44 stop:1162 length:1119 start_codon:yes stop_codon:yes gene_type:complete
MTNNFTTDVLIIGGGLHGTSTALHLRRRGLTVRIIEKHYPGRFASGVNAGGVRSLGRHPAEIPLSLAAMEIWHEMSAFIGDDCGFHRVGQVKIAESEAEMKELEVRVDSVRNLGFEHEELVGGNELRDLVPAAAPHCIGAIVCREDGAANPILTSKAFWRKAVEEGVLYELGSTVINIERVDGFWKVFNEKGVFEAPVLVNCAGAWGDIIAAMIGDCAPLKTEALTMMVTEKLSHFVRPVCGLASGGLSFKQSSEGTLLIGGGHLGLPDRDAETTEPDALAIMNSARIVTRVFPQLKDVSVSRVWCGLEGKLPDEIPVIGASENAPDAFHAFGFCGHGFQLSPIIGRLIAEEIIDGKSSLPIEAFAISRFSR